VWKPVLFANEVRKHWAALVTGGTLIGLLGIWQGTGHAVPTSVYWTIALVGLVVACCKAWIAKYEEVEKLKEEMQSKSGRPDLTAQFEVVDSPPRTMLILHNSSPSPAVGVNVQEIRNGTKVLQFSNPNPVRSGVPGTWVNCWILENGIQQRDDVMALFSGMPLIGQMSPTLDLRITFSSLDSKAAQRSWVLAIPFWYDIIRGKICTGQQSIDPLA
jgi:hypothetical protein